MKLVIVLYGFVAATGFVGVATAPGFFGNVGFLVVGALIGTYPVFLIDEFRRARDAKNLAKAIFHELANRAGRCCFDFEDPWAAYLQKQEMVDVSRLVKFSPDPPVIYPSVAPQIGLLRDDAAQAVIDFYIALAAWQRAIETAADEARQHIRPIPHGPVRLLSRRLRRTLEPGRRALAALARDVPNAEEIERSALKVPDSLFPDRHPNAGKTVRERITLMLNGTHE